LEDLRWLGLDWQAGPLVEDGETSYYQSQRGEIYAKYYTQLEQQGQTVYPCFCSPQELALSRRLQQSAGQAPRYAGTCAHLSPAEIAAKLAKGLQPTLRFRVPRGQTVEFVDLVRGPQKFACDDLGDFIIRRADGTPAFFFCNAVDDALMGITHVLRGEDHLANTPRQQLILQALGLPIPQYGHISLILGHDGTPLSKRNGSQSIQELRTQGWLAAGVVNYLARLGHTCSHDHFLSLPALAQEFSIERLGRAPAHFDEQQLRHWQQVAVSQTTEEPLWQWMGEAVHTLVPSSARAEFVATVRPNVVYPQDALYWARILFTEDWQIQPAAQALITEAGKAFLEEAVKTLKETQADYKKWVALLKDRTGKKGKTLFMPLRAALTGETHGPEMVHLLPLLGLERARERLQRAGQTVWSRSSGKVGEI
jgi:glutamyl-tRNA synthetase